LGFQKAHISTTSLKQVTGVHPPTINATVTALRFFFKVTLDWPETTRHLVFVYEPRKLPRVLSPEEVLRLLEAAPGPKHKATLSVAYGAGLPSRTSVVRKPPWRSALAAPPPAISRRFVPWRLSDAGYGASRIAAIGRAE
jgi:hypothetical protein